MTAAESFAPTAARPRADPPTPGPRAPLSARRINVVLAQATGIVGVVFGLQSLPVMLAQVPLLVEPWGLVIAMVVYAGIVLVAVSTLLGRATRLVCGGFALAYLTAVLLWPLEVADPAAFADATPWIWYLCTVATVNAAISFRLEAAAVFTVVTPICYGVIRILPAGGDVGLMRAALDTVYAIILGAAVLIIITSLRQAAAAVDTAQAAALEKYSTAVTQHAREVERVQVDAIVHDSVLTTLLAAAGAESAEQRSLAAAMARAAEERLDQARSSSPQEDGRRSLDELVRRLGAAASSVKGGFVIRASRTAERTIPVHAADALQSAAIQAMVNSMQHASPTGAPVRRRLTLTGVAGGCRIVVTDSGVGFIPDAVPEERLGLRVSIREQMESVGGTALVSSTPGEGTTIRLTWPADPAVAARAEDER